MMGFMRISISYVIIINIVQCMVNYISLLAGKLESHCTLQILDEYQD